MLGFGTETPGFCASGLTALIGIDASDSTASLVSFTDDSMGICTG